jgi:excisionase family DNA binding protein
MASNLRGKSSNRNPVETPGAALTSQVSASKLLYRLEEAAQVTQPETASPVLRTCAGAQEQLSVSRPTVYRLIERGELETVHIGRALRITQDSIDLYVTRLRTAGRRSPAAAA